MYAHASVGDHGEHGTSEAHRHHRGAGHAIAEAGEHHESDDHPGSTDLLEVSAHAPQGADHAPDLHGGKLGLRSAPSELPQAAVPDEWATLILAGGTLLPVRAADDVLRSRAPPDGTDPARAPPSV